MKIISLTLTFILLLSFSPTVLGQKVPPIQFQPTVDSPIGSRNPKAPKELSQYDFLIGDWDIEMNFRQANGEIQVYGAKWHNHWMVNGILLAQEWRGPFATGVEFRRYNSQSGKWEGRHSYNFKLGWKTSIAEKIGNEMIVIHEESEDPSGKTFILKETYHDMSENSFKMYAQRSYDNGRTWGDWTYKMVCTKAN